MERLKHLRVERGILQKDIAAYLHVDRTAYVRYENGVSEPKIETLILLADFFCVSLDYLLGRTDAPEPFLPLQPVEPPAVPSGVLTEKEKDLLNSFRKLNEEGQTAALATLRGLVDSGVYIKTSVPAEPQEEIG